MCMISLDLVISNTCKHVFQNVVQQPQTSGTEIAAVINEIELRIVACVASLGSDFTSFHIN